MNKLSISITNQLINKGNKTMMFDALLQFSQAQAITGNSLSTNNIDIGGSSPFGEGKELLVSTIVNQPFIGGTSLEIQIICAPTNNFANESVLGTSGPIPVTQLTTGKQKAIAISVNKLGDPSQRYIALRYVVVGTFTQGTISAGIVETIQDQKIFPVGYTVV